MLDLGSGRVLFERDATVLCAVNVTAAPFRLPEQSEVLLASAPLVDGLLPPGTAAWLRRAA